MRCPERPAAASPPTLSFAIAGPTWRAGGLTSTLAACKPAAHPAARRVGEQVGGVVRHHGCVQHLRLARRCPRRGRGRRQHARRHLARHEPTTGQLGRQREPRRGFRRRSWRCRCRRRTRGRWCRRCDVFHVAAAAQVPALQAVQAQQQQHLVLLAAQPTTDVSPPHVTGSAPPERAGGRGLARPTCADNNRRVWRRWPPLPRWPRRRRDRRQARRWRPPRPRRPRPRPRRANSARLLLSEARRGGPAAAGQAARWAAAATARWTHSSRRCLTCRSVFHAQPRPHPYPRLLCARPRPRRGEQTSVGSPRPRRRLAYAPASAAPPYVWPSHKGMAGRNTDGRVGYTPKDVERTIRPRRGAFGAKPSQPLLFSSSFPPSPPFPLSSTTHR